MTAQATALQAPASLIAERGTGEDVLGLIGKRVRVTKGAYDDLDPGLLAIFGALNGGIPEPLPIGAEGTVVHITDDGIYYADFGDDERVPKNGPEQVRVADVVDVTDDYRWVEVIA